MSEESGGDRKPWLLVVVFAVMLALASVGVWQAKERGLFQSQPVNLREDTVQEVGR